MPSPDPNREPPETQAALRSGDTRAFDRLFADLGPRVLGYLVRLTGNRAEAEDLVQETFLAAYTGRRSYSGRSQPLAWLLGIARRRWRDRWRKRKSLPESGAAPDTLSDGAIPISETVTRAAHLEWAIARLIPAQREVVLLVLVEGLSYREAAEVLEIPVGTVGWRVSEATRALRKILNACDEEEDDERTAAQPNPGAAYSPGYLGKT